ncbi:hypothetical protein LPJ61_002651 [Coemansia biformis]|uniref:Thioesterase domain-containing protein n=1 Tax=Coemansia biformis TaxID=1286918 RepID=A0A9W7Y7Z5_9FUNG|nr:hypothetical protein LPJ61_002651 [Coemansia biformis]
MREKLHGHIQRRLGRFTDLEEVEFHEFWGHSESHFMEDTINTGVLAMPTYWYSPQARCCAGLWQFTGKNLAPEDPIQETMLFTLADDVTGDLGFRAFHETVKEAHVGVTVKLDITRAGASPRGRLFYFEATAVSIVGRKLVVECPLWDADTGEQLITVKATHVFVRVDDYGRLSSAKKKRASAPPAPTSTPALTSVPVLTSLPQSDLRALNRVFNFFSPGRVEHTAGSIDEQAQRLELQLGFGSHLCGPPMYVHGGVLGTVLANASQLLLTKVAGLGPHAVVASAREVNYHRAIPEECKSATVEARIESADRSQVVVFSQILFSGRLSTILKTTFTLVQMPSKL